MNIKLYIRLLEILIPAIVAATFLIAWRAEHQDRAKLAADLATAQQALNQADSRQHDRDSQLLQTLSTLAADKRNVITPQQILRALPQQIPLPAPITLTQSPTANQPSSKAESTNANSQTSPDASATGNITRSKTSGNITAPSAVIPAEDLKPLYDFAVDCRACQAKLAASQADLTDEQTKTATLVKERDAAIRTAKGGSALRRIARAAKWFAIGAAAGAIAARTAH